MLIRYSLPAAAVLILVLSWTAVMQKNRTTSFEEKKEMIVMRQIGHKLLLQSGDSTSRVLPVQQISSNEFRLGFEASFSFKPDSLVKVVRNEIKKAGLPNAYVVNMLDCKARQVRYGFAITGTVSNDITGRVSGDIIPCLGREQEKACYILQLVFPEQSTKTWLYLIPIPLVIGLGAYMARSKWRKQKTIPVENTAPVGEEKPESGLVKTGFVIGKFFFDPVKQELGLDGEIITLTAKESKLLGILAASPNEVVDRGLLLKQVWEDEGVITGRSLDMFISKLRKKLQPDEEVSIINIHSKGYKLCVPAQQPA